MHEELKPCPFCGHIPQINEQKTIVCGYCGAHMHTYEGHLDWTVELWNRRAEVKGDA